MSGREPSPWDLLAGQVAPPPWRGPVTVYHLLAEDEDQREGVVAIDGGKVCCRCGETFPATSDYFYRCREKPDGLRSECKPCHRSRPCVVKQLKGGRK